MTPMNRLASTIQQHSEERTRIIAAGQRQSMRYHRIRRRQVRRRVGRRLLARGLAGDDALDTCDDGPDVFGADARNIDDGGAIRAADRRRLVLDGNWLVAAVLLVYETLQERKSDGDARERELGRIGPQKLPGDVEGSHEDGGGVHAGDIVRVGELLLGGGVPGRSVAEHGLEDERRLLLASAALEHVVESVGDIQRSTRGEARRVGSVHHQVAIDESARFCYRLELETAYR